MNGILFKNSILCLLLLGVQMRILGRFLLFPKPMSSDTIPCNGRWGFPFSSPLWLFQWWVIGRFILTTRSRSSLTILQWCGIFCTKTFDKWEALRNLVNFQENCELSFSMMLMQSRKVWGRWWFFRYARFFIQNFSEQKSVSSILDGLPHPPSWSCDQDRLNKLSFPHPKENLHEIWLNGPVVSEMFENIDDHELFEWPWAKVKEWPWLEAHAYLHVII